jgi:peptidyl-prolyl cis-trans isomerase A (cyclophilin A)
MLLFMNPTVVLTTPIGQIEVELYTQQAPITCANFLRYVQEDRYNQATFYRVVRLDNQPHSEVKIEVIQGGLGMADHPLKLPPIPQETTQITGLKHLDGSISMGRIAPDSAHSEFFICINDQPELDFDGRRNPDGQGFAAFGKVVRGMEVARQIQQGATHDQQLNEPVPFTAAVSN